MLLASTCLGALSAQAQDATWQLNPGSGDWNTAANWTPATVPTGTATFGVSNETAVAFSAPSTTVATIQFNAAASAYTFTIGGTPLVASHELHVVGTGIINNSGVVQNFNVDTQGRIVFSDAASAGGSNVSITNSSSTFPINAFGGTVRFEDIATAGRANILNRGIAESQFVQNSTAGRASITNVDFGSTFFFNGSTAADATIVNQAGNFAGGQTQFVDSSTAGNATILNSGGLTTSAVTFFAGASTAGNATIINSGQGALSGQTLFSSTAGNATIINNAHGLTQFFAGTAGNATITTNAGGFTVFQDNSTGGTARLITNAGGRVDVSPLTAAGMTVGSIEGAGTYFLGSKRLTVGGNNRSTEVSGIISDGGDLGFGSGGTGGSLTKAGTGTLILSGTNTYTGGTTINAGTLQLGNGGTTGSILGNVLDNGVFAIKRSDAFTFGGLISGTGAFQQNGTGTTILTGANTYTGGTTINDGTLQLGDATNRGSLIGNVVNSRTFNIVNADTSGITSIINNFNVEGHGLNFLNASSASNISITNNDHGDIDFQDQSTAGHATILNQGSLTFTDASTAGNATITNTNNAGMQFNRSASAGNAAINNNGAIGFLDNSTAGNANIINNGFIRFGDATSAGNSVITTNRFNLLLFDTTSTGGLARLITNAGGEVWIAGLSSTGMTAGSIEGAGAYLLGSKTLTVGGNNLSTEVSGVIADGPFTTRGGSLVKVGTGTLILSGTNSYTGGTIINGGTLQLGNGGTTGSILGNVVDNGVFAINRSDGFSFGGLISGSGAFEQRGAGTTTFTAANAYTGGTTVNAGTLRLGAGGSLASGGALTVNAGGTFDLNGHVQTVGDLSGAGNILLGAGTLTGGATNSTSFDGIISGTGSLVKQGSGALTLAGTNSYTGATSVHAGALIVNGSIASSSGVTVDPGAFVGGTGALPSLTLNGGTLSPGNSIGTITISGKLTFVGAGNYLVEVSPTAADRTNVSGTAALAGTLTIVPTGGTYTVGQRYVLLNATGGVTGTFGTVDFTSGFGAAFRPRIAYDGGNVFLVLDPNAISPFLPANASRNVRNVAGAIDAGFLAGNAPAPFLSLFNLPATALPLALSQLSGEIGTGAAAAGFQSMDQFLGLMLDPFLENRVGGANGAGASGPALAFAPEPADLPEAASAYARMVTKAPPVVPFDRRWSVWGAGYGGQGSFNGDPVVVGSHDLNVSNGGVAGGVDYRVSPDTVVGAALSGSSLSYHVNAGLGSGKGDAVQGGLYGSSKFDRAYVSAAASFGWYDLSTTRTVLLPGLTDRLDADFSARSIGGRIESGYRFPVLASAGVTPYGAVQAQSFRTPSYAERDVTGLAGFGLIYDAETMTDVRSELGARFDSRSVLSTGTVLILRGRAAWAHELDRDRSITATFQLLPAAPFTVFGATPARDAALVSAGAELRFAGGLAALAKFDGEFAGHTQVYAGSGILRYSW